MAVSVSLPPCNDRGRVVDYVNGFSSRWRRQLGTGTWRWRHIRPLWLSCVCLTLIWLAFSHTDHWSSAIHTGHHSPNLAPHEPSPGKPFEWFAGSDDDYEYEYDDDDWYFDISKDLGEKRIPIGQSIDIDGREVFWWEQFPRLTGIFHGRHSIVRLDELKVEQHSQMASLQPDTQTRTNFSFEPITAKLRHQTKQCYLDPDSEQIPVPVWGAYVGQPQGMSAPLFGSHEELGLDMGHCYDRISRLRVYGIEDELPVPGGDNDDNDDNDDFANSHMHPYSTPIDWEHQVNWASAQEKCWSKNKGTYATRTAVIIRTWHSRIYSKYEIATLRALIAELALQTGGEYTVHFLVHVQDDTLPIWASDDEYQRVLEESLPREFHGMATLWSVAEMMLVYPGPFPESIVNFSGKELYGAYRSLHFPLQYFASKHPEFDYFWQWEMDMRVTGHYHELFQQITDWAQAQPRRLAWERSSRFFIPSLYNNSYEEFAQAVEAQVNASGRAPISGPQVERTKLLDLSSQTPISSTSTDTDTDDDKIVDLIALNPLFDPNGTAWAFHEDITGYTEGAPPARAALITASRLSRRLLLLMHEESFRLKHTMFPEMFPASVAFQYGLHALSAPIPIYFDRDWPALHADEIFNNALVSQKSIAKGLIHDQGYFYGPQGSVFGPGEHVFRGSTYYSNAAFASYLWRRWLGHENANDEIAQESRNHHHHHHHHHQRQQQQEQEQYQKQGDEGGRMCLPMMLLHPIKED